jgi:hypothetical protein
MIEKQDKSAWKCSEGVVNQKYEHIQIRYNDNPDPVALIAQGKKRSFVVQFIPQSNPESTQAKKILEEVRKELDFFLVEKGEERPWGYALYHCRSAVNIYSKVHWSYYPEGHIDAKRIRILKGMKD